jgi:hypothetical protein
MQPCSPGSSRTPAQPQLVTADPREQEHEECAPEQLGAALLQQEAADEEERQQQQHQQQQQPPAAEARSSRQAALLWSMGVNTCQDLLDPAARRLGQAPSCAQSALLQQAVTPAPWQHSPWHGSSNSTCCCSRTWAWLQPIPWCQQQAAPAGAGTADAAGGRG